MILRGEVKYKHLEDFEKFIWDYSKNTFTYVVFIHVYKILEAPEFDNVFWNKITFYLPDVKWYNSWDKRKRLRKYARKMR